MKKINYRYLIKYIFIVFMSVLVIAGCSKEEKPALEEPQKINAAQVESKPEAIKQAEPVPLKPVIAEPSAIQ